MSIKMPEDWYHQITIRDSIRQHRRGLGSNPPLRTLESLINIQTKGLIRQPAQTRTILGLMQHTPKFCRIKYITDNNPIILIQDFDISITPMHHFDDPRILEHPSQTFPDTRLQLQTINKIILIHSRDLYRARQNRRILNTNFLPSLLSQILIIDPRAKLLINTQYAFPPQKPSHLP